MAISEVFEITSETEFGSRCREGSAMPFCKSITTRADFERSKVFIESTREIRASKINKQMSRVTDMTCYVVLLRGINVGGNNIIKMTDLSKSLAKAGFENIVTILASGNIILDSNEDEKTKVAKAVSQAIRKDFNLEIAPTICSNKEILKIDEDNPFGSDHTVDAHNYVTFLNEKPKNKEDLIKKNAKSAGFEILKIEVNVAYSRVKKDAGKSVDFMKFMEKEFGKDTTARNWNTVQKIVKEVRSRN